MLALQRRPALRAPFPPQTGKPSPLFPPPVPAGLTHMPPAEEPPASPAASKPSLRAAAAGSSKPPPPPPPPRSRAADEPEETVSCCSSSCRHIRQASPPAPHMEKGVGTDWLPGGRAGGRLGLAGGPVKACEGRQEGGGRPPRAGGSPRRGGKRKWGPAEGQVARRGGVGKGRPAPTRDGCGSL